MRKIEIAEYYPIILGSLPGLIILVISNMFTTYGYNGDELCFLQQSRHLDWCYNFLPPLCQWLLMISTFIFGKSLFAIRIIPMLSHFFISYTTGLISRNLNSGRFFIFISALTAGLCPNIIKFGTYYSHNSLEILLWVASLYLILLIIKNNKPKYWIYLGITFGLSSISKYTSLIFVLSVAVSFLFFREFRTKHIKDIIISLIIAFVIFLPNLTGMIKNNFIAMDLIKSTQSNLYVMAGPVNILLYHCLGMNPLYFAVCITGVLVILFNRNEKQFRIFSVIFLISLGFIFITKQNLPHRIVGVYIAFISFGMYSIEKYYFKIIKNNKFLFSTCIVFFGIITLPISVPLINPGYIDDFFSLFGMKNTEYLKGVKSNIPALMSDSMGWEDFACNTVNQARGRQKLTGKDKKMFILVPWYPQAASLDIYIEKNNIKNIEILCSSKFKYLYNISLKEQKEIVNAGFMIAGIDSNYFRGFTTKFTTIGYYPGNQYASITHKNINYYYCDDKDLDLALFYGFLSEKYMY